MEKFNLVYLVTTCANIYFWLFIVAYTLNILYHSSDAYDEAYKGKVALGKGVTGISMKSLIAWFLFFLSIYYKN